MQISSDKITNFIIYGLGQSINLLSPLIVMPHLVIICKESGLGKIGIAFSISLILNCIIDYSSYLNGTKEIVINKEKKNFLSHRITAIYSYKILLFILISFIGILLILSIPLITEKKLFLYSIPILASQVLNPNWILQGLEQFKQIAVYNVFSKLIYIALVYLFIKNSNDYIWANFFLGIGGTVVYLIVFFMIILKLNLKFGKESIMQGIQILKKDFNICISEFCLSIYQFFPIIIVGILTGNASAGIYRIIEQIFSVFRTFIFMFFNFSYPTICYDIEKDPKKGFKTWKLYHLGNLVIIAFGCTLVFVFGRYVLQYFNLSLTEANNLLKLLRFAIIVPIILVISQALRQLMFAYSLTNIYTKIIYFSSFINLVLLFLFVKLFDLTGAFISMIVVETIVILLYIKSIKRKKIIEL